MPTPCDPWIATLFTRITAAGVTAYPLPMAAIVGSLMMPKFPPPMRNVHDRSISDVGLTPRSVPHPWFALSRLNVTKRVLLVPAATRCELPPTLIVAPWLSETMAQGWIVTTALPLMVMLFGTLWVTPSPAQVSSARMLLECVVTVPFAVPHAAARAVTVTAADPLF